MPRGRTASKFYFISQEFLLMFLRTSAYFNPNATMEKNQKIIYGKTFRFSVNYFYLWALIFNRNHQSKSPLLIDFAMR